MAENNPHSITNPYNEDEHPKHEKYQGFIRSMEDAREKLESYRGSKLYKEQDAIRLAIDTLYRHIRIETGYRIGWLVDEIDGYLDKIGRPSIYQNDEKITACRFIHLLIQYGSSKAQAINLLSLLLGNRVVTEGFKKELGDSYKEFSGSYSNKLSAPAIAKTIINCSALASLETLNQSTDLIKESLSALKKACQETIDYMRKYRDIVIRTDPSHQEYHSAAINIMNRTEDNPVAYFFSQTIDKSDNSERRNRKKIEMEITDYLNTIDLLIENP